MKKTLALVLLLALLPGCVAHADLKSSFDSFKSSLGGAWDAFVDLTDEAKEYVGENLSSWMDDAAAFFNEHFGALGREISEAWDVLKDAAVDAGKHTAEELKKARDTLEAWLEDYDADEEVRAAVEGVIAAATLPGVYTYEGEGFGGAFTITLSANGSYTFTEGLLSSYLGSGLWNVNGDELVLTENPENGAELINRFRVGDDQLVFIEAQSSNFLHITVPDGAVFAR